jgi:hypothetical protein
MAEVKLIEMKMEQAIRGVMKSKKGIVFILITLLIVSFITLLFTTGLQTPIDEKMTFTEARVNTLNRFVIKFPQQVSIAVRSQSQQAFEELSQEMLTQRQYVPNVQDAFANCLMNGTVIIGVSRPCGQMENKTLPKILNSIVQLASTAMNVNITYSVSDIEVNQSYPFEVQIAMNLTYYVADSSAAWNKTVNLKTSVPVLGITDKKDTNRHVECHQPECIHTGKGVQI